MFGALKGQTGEDMDIFTRFNRNHIKRQQLDTLIGLSKGITADGRVNQPEAELLHRWLIQNHHSENPVIVNLLAKVTNTLEQDLLDAEESAELLAILRTLVDGGSEVGEVTKTTAQPICSPPPKLDLVDKTCLFARTFAYDTRQQCQAAIETFGQKIEKAMKYRGLGLPVVIVGGEWWVDRAGF